MGFLLCRHTANTLDMGPFLTPFIFVRYLSFIVVTFVRAAIQFDRITLCTSPIYLLCNIKLEQIGAKSKKVSKILRREKHDPPTVKPCGGNIRAVLSSRHGFAGTRNYKSFEMDTERDLLRI